MRGEGAVPCSRTEHIKQCNNNNNKIPSLPPLYFISLLLPFFSLRCPIIHSMCLIFITQLLYIINFPSKHCMEKRTIFFNFYSFPLSLSNCSVILSPYFPRHIYATLLYLFPILFFPLILFLFATTKMA